MDTPEFRTELFLQAPAFKLSLASKIFLTGSCFADVMGQKLENNKIEVLTNPFGIIFNPLSLAKTFNYLNPIYQDTDIDKLILERDQLFYHYDFHSSFSGPTAIELKNKINKNLAGASYFLSRANVVIITLGTSFVYQHIEMNEYVANCHKMPSALFKKEMLAHDVINRNLGSIVENIKNTGNGAKVIFTVSPVRHTKDSITLNSASKALLRASCHWAEQQFPKIVSYFPAFEIMMDDLRDYRFYKKDMIHPSEVAEDYIWKKFVENYYDDEALAFFEKWEKIKKLMGHRFFNKDNEKYFAFVSKTLGQLRNVSNLVNVNTEIAEWENKLPKIN